MNERAEKFRQQLQKELGLTVGPKDPILAEWLAHEEFREEIAAEHQRMLVAFEEALMKNQASWSESAKNLANQSLNAALGAAREHIAALAEEAGRSQAGVGPSGGGTRRRTPGKGGSETCSTKLGDVRRSGDRVIGGGEPYCCAAFALIDAERRSSWRSFQSGPSIF
jgi:hypothetical protein